MHIPRLPRFEHTRINLQFPEMANARLHKPWCAWRPPNTSIIVLQRSGDTTWAIPSLRKHQRSRLTRWRTINLIFADSDLSEDPILQRPKSKDA